MIGPTVRARARTILSAHLVQDAIAAEAAADGVLWLDLINDAAVAAEIVGHSWPCGREDEAQPRSVCGKVVARHVAEFHAYNLYEGELRRKNDGFVAWLGSRLPTALIAPPISRPPMAVSDYMVNCYSPTGGRLVSYAQRIIYIYQRKY